ncbi:5'-nucleotidase C-terminal domain-containing protein [Spirosoma taeanense]|uniref:5'-nucleotidase C-terminal domain-containing protein n=1 Tax=Spirosoma taeanense TaxID=2735870 RepID=A0A6M5YCW9_9BACT|nr:5'-nucleotidase C-terminal domain-containing protein [Spirosoma taeanense]QJW91136.1 5'-nucleotidase C-terminal domain-containing protein [Spirosoma taeanense]
MRKTLLYLVLAGLSACQSSYHLTSRTANRIVVDSVAAPADSSVTRFLQPYKQGLDKSMNEVLVRLSQPLEKRSPESALDDMLADALLKQASQRYGKAIDVSHLNYGGIRNGLPAGNITVGNVFEVMPFDNQLVVLTLTGKQLQQFLDHFATNDEALVVGGIRAVINNKAVRSVTFTNGRTLQPDQTYTVAMSDYIANGGSGAGFLKAITQRDNVNYLIRDALIEYLRQQGKSGQPFNPQADGRITLE